MTFMKDDFIKTQVHSYILEDIAKIGEIVLKTSEAMNTIDADTMFKRYMGKDYFDLVEDEIRRIDNIYSSSKNTDIESTLINNHKVVASKVMECSISTIFDIDTKVNFVHPDISISIGTQLMLISKGVLTYGPHMLFLTYFKYSDLVDKLKESYPNTFSKFFVSDLLCDVLSSNIYRTDDLYYLNKLDNIYKIRRSNLEILPIK